MQLKIHNGLNLVCEAQSYGSFFFCQIFDNESYKS